MGSLFNFFPTLLAVLLPILAIWPTTTLWSQDEISAVDSANEIVTPTEIENITNNESTSSFSSPANSAQFPFLNGEKTLIEEPFKMRDPFKRIVSLGKESVATENSGELSYSDGAEKKDIKGIPLDRIKVVGVLLGKNRRAMAKVAGSDGVYVLKEGMLLGEEELELKAILPGGIVLIEKIKNIYDQEEYLETIIPITSETNIK